MIKSIRLKNFQGHQDSFIEFDSQINTITGSSDAGKSSILRAVRWVTENRPSGDGIVSHWNLDSKDNIIDETSVEIVTDSHTVKRIKRKGFNGYEIDGVELSCIGRDVPAQVTQAIPLDKVNIHKQLEPHFLLSDTPGKVAEYLNSIIGLSSIDAIIAKAEQDVRAAKATVEETEATIKKETATVDSLAFIDEAVITANSIEAIEWDNEQAAKDIKELADLVTQYNTIAATIGDKMTITYMAKPVITEINSIQEVSREINKECMHLTNTLMQLEGTTQAIAKKPIEMEAMALLREINELQTTIAANTKTITNISDLIRGITASNTMTEKKGLVTEAMAYIDRIKSIQSKNWDVASTIVTIEKLVDEIQYTEQKIQEMRVELERLRKELPEKCPSCGSYKIEGGCND